jgi:hypothetical protein
MEILCEKIRFPLAWPSRQQGANKFTNIHASECELAHSIQELLV